MAFAPVSAGQLKHQVQFQQRAAGTNGLREANGAWVNLWAPVWAKAEPLTGREFLAAGAMQQAVTTRFVIRHRAGVTEQLRLVWQGTPYDIVSALPIDGGTEWIEIMAVSGVRDARS